MQVDSHHPSLQEQISLSRFCFQVLKSQPFLQAFRQYSLPLPYPKFNKNTKHIIKAQWYAYVPISTTPSSDCSIVEFHDITQTLDNSAFVSSFSVSFPPLLPFWNMLKPWDKLYQGHKMSYTGTLSEMKINM